MGENVPWSDASDEPLEVIEANECKTQFGSLCTRRFRRVFNELAALRQQAVAVEAARADLHQALISVLADYVRIAPVSFAGGKPGVTVTPAVLRGIQLTSGATEWLIPPDDPVRQAVEGRTHG
jgi:hypothetical protein